MIAHELGHHVQQQLGTSDEVSRIRRDDPDRANDASVRLELQADCYAGVWARGVFEAGARGGRPRRGDHRVRGGRRRPAAAAGARRGRPGLVHARLVRAARAAGSSAAASAASPPTATPSRPTSSELPDVDAGWAGAGHDGRGDERRQAPRGGPRLRRGATTPSVVARPAARRRRRCPRPFPRRRPSGSRRPSSASRSREGGERRLRRLGQPPLERREQLGQRRFGAGGPACGARRARSAGSAARSTATLSADAEHRPALVRPGLDEDARQLAAVEQHVVGPLDARGAAGEVGDREAGAQRQQRRPGRAGRARAAAPGPAGADQVRPWRPRPAVCSPAVTSVPCGAPAAASSRARSLVDPVVAQVQPRAAERAHAARELAPASPAAHAESRRGVAAR